MLLSFVYKGCCFSKLSRPYYSVPEAPILAVSLTSLFLVFSASPYNAALFLPPLLPFLRTDHSSELQQKDSSLKTLPGHMGKA